LPEGPEVKRISSGVAKRIVGKTITDVIGLDPRYDVRNSSAKQVRDDVSQFLVEITTDGLTVDEVNCYGKFIYWKLTNNSTNEVWTIFHTLGMAGTWRFTPNNNHLAMEWKFDDGSSGSSIYYRDSRRFGTFKFFKGPSGRDLLEKKISVQLGPDLLATPRPTLEKFSEALRKGSRSSWTLAKVLMNQKVVAGIGNYLKAEILFETKLSPYTTVNQLSPTEMENLYHACIKHIHNAYAAKGATIKNYVLPDGTLGSAQYNFKVYAQKTCPEGHLISREETEDKRTTHWCSTCQSVPESSEPSAYSEQEKLIKIN
jgi:formamidopyrimidine-DNA glycosylase